MKKIIALVLAIMTLVVTFNVAAKDIDKTNWQEVHKTKREQVEPICEDLELISASVTILTDALIKQTEDNLRNKIPDYSLSDLVSLDLTKPSGITAEELEKVAKYGLDGLGDEFIKAEADYHINAVFLMSIAILESGWGRYMFRPNNMFGFYGHDFSSKAECVDVVASKIARNYLTDGGAFHYGNTVRDVNTKYATNPEWHLKVARNMKMLYSDMREDLLSEK